MRDYFKIKTWIITTLMFVIAFGLSFSIVYYEFGFRQNIKISNADASNNVSGFAWSSNIGWVSFNCTNDNTCDTPNHNYGVSIDPVTGNFSGYAWSPSVGWIDFAPTSGYPAVPNIGAHYNSATGVVTGWAKILTLGANGWLKMSDDSVTVWNGKGVKINSTTGDLSGYAWNGNATSDTQSGIGWLSFNCSNEIPACSGTNYKVVANINNPPTVTDLTAPNWNYTQASTNSLRANLQFNFVDSDNGSYGSAYEIIVKKADDTLVLDTGKCTGYQTPSADCKIDNTICMRNGLTGCINPGDCVCQYALDESKLEYGKSYKWSVQVWDNNNVASALTSYNTNPDTDNDDGVVPTFTTYKHKFPEVSATYSPTKPNLGEAVKFTDTSKTFLTAQPTTAVSCSNPERCSWLWTVPNGATINDSATSTPTIIFNNTGSNNVILIVTDLIDHYYSKAIITVNVNAQLPKWKEVK